MRVYGIKLSNVYKNRKEIVKIINEVEKEIGISVIDHIPKVIFDNNFHGSGAFNNKTREIILNPSKINPKILPVEKGFSPSEKTILAHEVVHAIQRMKKLGHAVVYWGSLVDYYQDAAEFEAQNTAIKLYGTKKEKKVWKDLAKRIKECNCG